MRRGVAGICETGLSLIPPFMFFCADDPQAPLNQYTESVTGVNVASPTGSSTASTTSAWSLSNDQWLYVILGLGMLALVLVAPRGRR